MQEAAPTSWFRLRQDLFAIQICPWTHTVLMRGVLPGGSRVEIPPWVLERVRAWELSTVTVRVRLNEESPTPTMLRVNADALLEAIVPVH